jgi:hypothetical protein
LASSGSFVIPRYTFVIPKGFGPEPMSRDATALPDRQDLDTPSFRRAKPNSKTWKAPPFHPRRPGLDVEERPFRAASKSYEAGLQPRRESFQNVVATVNRNVFSGSFNT